MNVISLLDHTAGYTGTGTARYPDTALERRIIPIMLGAGPRTIPVLRRPAARHIIDLDAAVAASVAAMESAESESHGRLILWPSMPDWQPAIDRGHS